MTIEKLKSIIDNSNNIVFFGGAGVSTESNIPDFRSASGLYNTKGGTKYSPEYMLSHTFFNNHTDEFFEFYKTRIVHRGARPNPAHLVLSELEKRGKLKAVITQNIDGLHQMAGSKNVLELHGSINRNYCTKCSKFFHLDYIMKDSGIPKCDECHSLVKPDVVLYQESLDMDILNQALEYVENADVLIIGGTSLMVYPAANLIKHYKGDKLVLINKSETSYDSRALLSFNTNIGEVLKQII